MAYRSCIFQMATFSLFLLACGPANRPTPKKPTVSCVVSDDQFEQMRLTADAAVHTEAFREAANYIDHNLQALTSFAQTITDSPLTFDPQHPPATIVLSRRIAGLNVTLMSLGQFDRTLTATTETGELFHLFLQNFEHAGGSYDVAFAVGQTLQWGYRAYDADTVTIQYDFDSYFGAGHYTYLPLYQANEYSIDLQPGELTVAATKVNYGKQRGLTAKVNGETVCQPEKHFWPELLPFPIAELHIQQLAGALAHGFQIQVPKEYEEIKYRIPPEEEWGLLPKP